MPTIPVELKQVNAQELIEELSRLTDRAHREALCTELSLSGHVPEHMISFIEIPVQFYDTAHVLHELLVYILPDYLMIGTSDDHLRTPMSPTCAQRICDAWNCSLPTTQLVDIMWNNSPARVTPQPWGPPYDASMMSLERIVEHNARINTTIEKAEYSTTQLITGHKKDVVITNKLISKPKQVAIYGWHQLNGKPIQPLYLGHEASYADYSMGIRLISNECVLDNQTDDLRRIMKDKNLCCAISSEGSLKLLKQPN